MNRKQTEQRWAAESAWIQQHADRLRAIPLDWMNSPRNLHELLTRRIPSGHATVRRSRELLAAITRHTDGETDHVESASDLAHRRRRADRISNGLTDALDFSGSAWDEDFGLSAERMLAWARNALIVLGGAHLKADTLRAELAAVRQRLQEVAEARTAKSRLARERKLAINRLTRTVAELEAELTEMERTLALRDTQLAASGEALASARHALGVAERAVALLEMAAGRRALDGGS